MQINRSASSCDRIKRLCLPKVCERERRYRRPRCQYSINQPRPRTNARDSITVSNLMQPADSSSVTKKRAPELSTLAVPIGVAGCP